MNEDSEYHAYICMDEGCTNKCLSFTRNDDTIHDEEPCSCLFAGTEVHWKKLEDYLEEMKKLKNALDLASKAIDEIEQFGGEK